MNGRRVKWIQKLFIKMDPGLILSMNKIYGDQQTKLQPRRLNRKAKKMWSRHHPSTKTWGKTVDLRSKGVKNDSRSNR